MAGPGELNDPQTPIPTPSPGLWVYRPCEPTDWPAVLDILYHRWPRNARANAARAAFDEAQAGRLDLAGLWAAWCDHTPRAALLTQGLAGRAAAFWPPEARGLRRRKLPPTGADAQLAAEAAQAAAALTAAALDSYETRGFRLAQALVDRRTPPAATAALESAGLRRITELESLRRPTQPPISPPPGRTWPNLHWQGFHEAGEAAFARALEASYQGSLDMPELEGVRSLADVLAAHRAAGQFEPSRWRLGQTPDQPDTPGVILLLSAWPERDVWEVGYLGVPPALRGQGAGLAALAHALDLARPHASHLELAVDHRNTPARHLYTRANFHPFDHRTVLLARLTP